MKQRQTSYHYNCRAMADLAGQMLFTPRQQRERQILQAEKLHDELDPNQNYPFDFIHYRITGYHSEMENEDATIVVGQAVLPDLRYLIDQLSRSAQIPVNEPIYDVNTLAKKMQVSTRTLSRWRKLGLRWRWFHDPQTGKRTLGFPQSAIDRFLSCHPQRVAWASHYHHMSPRQREDLLRQARQLHQTTGLSRAQVASRLAQQTHRAVQTLRNLLEQYDRQHPEDPIFPNHRPPLTPRQCRDIARAHRRGQSLPQLCKAYGRTLSTLRRAITQYQVALLMRVPLSIQKHDAFNAPDADQRFARRVLNKEDWLAPPKDMGDLPSPLDGLYHQAQWTAEASLQQLRCYQYLKYRVFTTRSQIKSHRSKIRDIRQIQQDIRLAGKLRDEIINAHMPIVLTMARRYTFNERASQQSLYHLLQIGNRVLFEAMESFDPLRRQTFESFLKWRLQRLYAKGSDTPPPQPIAVKRQSPAQVYDQMRYEAVSRGIRLKKVTEAKK